MAYQKPNDPMAKVVLVVSVVVLLATLYVLISDLFKTIENNTTKGLEDSSLQMAAADQNIKPLGAVHTVDKSIAPKVKTGDEVYTAICAGCHDSGALGAPKVSAKDDWSSRMSGGLKALMDSAINGKGQMPARGGDPSLTDEEIQNAILFMTKKAGFDLSGEVAEAGGDSKAEEKGEKASTDATEEPAAPNAPAQDTAPSAPSAPVAPEVVATPEGEKIYKGLCFSCHDAGVAGSPKLGDVDAWTDRIAQGMDTLYSTSINGKGAMPAKGGNPALTDDEIKLAVDFMVAESKGEAPSKAPEAPVAEEEEAEAPEAQNQSASAEVVATPEGEKIYKGLCFSCHDSGVAGSPKLGDVDAWADRIAQGMDTLYSTSINGKGAMPAKGGNPALTDDEIKLAVDFMIAKSKGEASAAPAEEAKPDVAAEGKQAAAGGAELVATAEGEALYKTLCFSCHDMGIAGSPKIGETAAWTDRIAQGMDTLYANSINGKGAMPAKGGNPSLSDDEIKAAVDYMIVNSK